MIQIQAIGNLGRDAEAKTINDKQYLSFSVASTEKRNNEENTTWLSVLCPYQEALLPYLKKGQQVFVSGRMSAKLFQTQNTFGIDISVFANTIHLCGSKREESVADGSHVSTQQPSPQPAPQHNNDDLPF
jgi:single-stranded DNA-binding protein